MQLIIGLAVGIIGASIVWFFVIRNNKERFLETLGKANAKIAKLEELAASIKK